MRHYWKEKILLESEKSHLGRILGWTSLLCQQQSGIVGLWCWKVLGLTISFVLIKLLSLHCTFLINEMGLIRLSFTGQLQWSPEIFHDKRWLSTTINTCLFENYLYKMSGFCTIEGNTGFVLATRGSLSDDKLCLLCSSSLLLCISIAAKHHMSW